MGFLLEMSWRLTCASALERLLLRIPVNVTADSGNVTGIPANVTDGSVLRVLILCRRAFPAGFLSPYSVSLEFAGPCQAAGGPPGHACTHA